MREEKNPRETEERRSEGDVERGGERRGSSGLDILEGCSGDRFPASIRSVEIKSCKRYGESAIGGINAVDDVAMSLIELEGGGG